MKWISLRDYEARRIALIKPSALGDVIHALPVLAALRARFPRAHITWIINRSYEALVKGHPDLNGTLPFERGAMRQGGLEAVRAFLHFLKELRRARFDLVIDLQGLLRTGLMCRAAGARRRVGLASAREGAAWFYTDRLRDLPPGTREVHAVDRYWSVAEALGVGGLPKQFHVPISVADRRWAEERLVSQPRPVVAMNAGTRWETKRWPVRYFAELARRALERFGGVVLLVGGADEIPLAVQMRQTLGNSVLDFTGQTDVGRLAALLTQADVMVSNDSGPLHLAAALGRPVVAPYTCTSPARTGPYAQPGGAVCTTVWCAASYLKHCNRLECMEELTPERLWPVLEETLLRSVAKHRNTNLPWENLSA